MINIMKLLHSKKNTNNKKKVYISGPIKHKNFTEVRHTFDRAESLIKTYTTLEPINPLNNGIKQIEGDTNWQEHMREDIKNLCSCDYIMFLPGWTESKGCRLELDIAASIGTEILLIIEDESDWNKIKQL